MDEKNEAKWEVVSNSRTKNFQKLKQKFKKLQFICNELHTEHNELHTEHIELQTKYNELHIKNVDCLEIFFIGDSEHIELQTKYNELYTKYVNSLEIFFIPMVSKHNDFVTPWTLITGIEFEAQVKHCYREEYCDIYVNINMLYEFYINLHKKKIPEDLILLMISFIPPMFGHREEIMSEQLFSQWDYLCKNKEGKDYKERCLHSYEFE